MTAKNWHKISDYAIRYGDMIGQATDPTVCKVNVREGPIYEAWVRGKVIARSASPDEVKAIVEKGDL